MRRAASLALLASSILAPAEGGEGAFLAAGGYHSLAIGPDGRVWAWGANQHGQIGDGTRINRPLPFLVKVADGPRVIALAAGEDHTLLLREDGGLWAMGRNDLGQLGDGGTVDRDLMVRVAGLSDVVAMAAGSNHSVALTRQGAVHEWGCLSGRVALRPTRRAPLGDVAAVAAGSASTLALMKDGTVVTWEAGKTSRRVVPLPGRAVAIAAGAGHAMAVLQDGSLFGWGQNRRGELGTPASSRVWPPSRSRVPARVQRIFAGSEHSVALDESGQVWVMGDNNLGQLCAAADGWAADPVLARDSSGAPLRAREVAVGGYHTLLLAADQLLLGCGFNFFSQLGDWTEEDRREPTPVWRQLFRPSPPR